MVRKPVFKEGEIIRHVEEDEFDAVLDLLESAFPHAPRSFFVNITLNDPHYDPRYSLAVERDGMFLSYVQIFERTIWIDGQRIRLGGIGSVGTPPQYRRRGYATALMLEAQETMQNAGLQAGMLFTAIQPFYAKLGWKTVHQYYQEIPLPDSIFDRLTSSEVDMSEVERVPWPLGEEIPGRLSRSIKSLYNKSNPQQTGTIERNTEYWSRMDSWCQDPGAILRINGHTKAYYRYRLIEERCLLVTEFGLASAKEAEAMIQSLLLTAKEYEMESIQGCFYSNRFLRKYLENSKLPIQNRLNEYMMWHDLGSKKPHYPLIEAAAQECEFRFWVTDAF